MTLLNLYTPLVRVLVLLVLYAAALSLSRWLAYQLRFDFEVPKPFSAYVSLHMVWVVGLKLVVLGLFRQFSGLLSFFSIPDLRRLFFACSTASFTLLILRYFKPDFYSDPRGVILIDFVLSVMGLAMVRLNFRLIRERLISPQPKHHRRMKRVGIIGAGDVGATLAKELIVKRGLGLQPAAFFDDDKRKWRSTIHDIPVVGPPEMLLEGGNNLQLDEVIIAMPSAPAKRIGEVVGILQKTRLKFETVPSMDQLATGQVKVSQLRTVEIQDLLGRPPVKLEMENIRGILAGKVVMVTGAGGSIGSELCRQIASFNPHRLLLVEQCEVQIFQIEQELIEKGFGGIVLPLVADILDKPRMRYIFDRFRPNVIFHAAAHKHVPMMERQPGEAIKNNTIGTAQVAELAGEFKAERFVLISTDKAINPTNVMGATKRMAEIFIQALHARNGGVTKFMAVRFGNVLGSSGSVIPIFKQQIAAGGPVKVTHPDVTRYFMTIPEAVGLVLQSGAQGEGGEIFVLDMGQPVKIVDLARQLIELSGLKPDEDIEIEYVGLRPGEKLFEELSHKGENITTTHHPKIMRLVCTPAELGQIRQLFAELMNELHEAEPAHLKMLIKKVVPEYQPYLT
ncbi:MAG: nucleoside-diphosphate sugar epimerase/dehydratase [Verrucomicrobiota bacterium]|nr:nucleoside-diphosphate sugar epimerase/dehydratase [Verrucomicrobiota bacterium]